jgi:hypothetical protein
LHTLGAASQKKTESIGKIVKIAGGHPAIYASCGWMLPLAAITDMFNMLFVISEGCVCLKNRC